MKHFATSVVLVAAGLAFAVSACAPPDTGPAPSTTIPSPTTVPTSYREGRCNGTEGVTVVVDFAFFEDRTVVRCALGPQTNGAAALGHAGFVHDAGRYPGTVCQLNGLPAAGHPACWSTVGYWSYWRATSTGAPWVYSEWGFMAGPTPAPGSVEGWRFAPFAAGTAQPPRVGTGG